MRSDIPNFWTLICPLAECLEAVYKVTGKRTVLESSKVLLCYRSHTQAYTVEFENCRTELEKQVKFANKDISGDYFYIQMRLTVFGLVSSQKFMKKIYVFPMQKNGIIHNVSFQAFFTVPSFAGIFSKKIHNTPYRQSIV